MAEHPALPDDELRAALAQGHAAHTTIAKLRTELEKGLPSRDAIETHVHHLRSFPEIAAIIANWWDDPQTQRFIASLSSAGL